MANKKGGIEMKNCHRHAARALCSVAGMLFAASAFAADADVTGLVPTIWWDFETQPAADGLTAANKGSASITFTHEGTKTYSAGAISGTYAIDTSKFTAYSGAGSLSTAGNPFTLSLVMTLGTKTNGITLNVRTTTGDLIIRRSADTGSLVIGWGEQQKASSHMLTTTFADGDAAYHLVSIVGSSTGTELYVDGQLAGSSADFTPWSSSGKVTEMQFGGHLGVGAASGEAKNGGLIDDLRIHDAALTPAQIKAIAQEYRLVPMTDALNVSGSPGNLGTVVPRYGITNGLAQADVIACSAASSESATVKSVPVGYGLYSVAADGAETLVEESAATSFTYTHGTTGAHLVWRWASSNYVEVVSGGGGTVSSGGWAEAGGSFAATATPAAGHRFHHWECSAPLSDRLSPSVVIPSVAEPLTLTAVFVDRRLDVTLFEKRIPIVVSGYAGTSDLSDFPVLVKLSQGSTTGFDYDDCAEDGSDIRFSDANGAIVPHEIESWNRSGDSFIWVQVPVLSGTTTALSLYYGADPTALPAVDPKEVWTHYAVVVHGGSGISDSSPSALAVVNGGGVAATADSGIVAGGLHKAARDSKGVNIPNPVTNGKLSDTKKFTLTTWYKAGATGTSCMSASKSAWNGTGFLLVCESGSYMSVAVNGHQGASGKGALVIDKWAHVAFSYDTSGEAGSLRTYFDGESIYSNDAARTPTDGGATYWTVGSYADAATGDSYIGDMDEIRIFDGIASADWIKAEYDSVTDPASFVSLSPAELNDLELPRFGALSASDENGVATFSVALDRPAFGGAAPTSVSVFYGTDGENWTELPLGATNEVGTLTGAASGLTGNARYVWYASASATQDASTKEATSSQQSFVTRALDPAASYRSFTATVDWDGEPVENVPVLLRISESAINGFRYVDVTESRFEILDEDGHLLPYEIDTWNTDGESLVWILLPDYHDGATFTVRYGASFANTPIPSTNIWAEYKGVWHMNSVDPADSTANGFNGTHKTRNLSVVNGAIGSAVNVPRSNNADGISCGKVIPNSELTDGFTVEGWCRPTQYGSMGDGAAMFGKNAFISVRIKDATHVTVTTPGKADHPIDLASGVLPAVGEWWHFAVTFKMNTANDGLNFYVNGQLAYSRGAGDINEKVQATELFLGRNQWEQPFKGDIDEMRLSAGIRSANEIAAEYHAMADASALVCSATTSSDTDDLEIGDLSAMGGSGSATFSVALDRPAFDGAVPTSVSVFYGTDGEHWTEFALGSTNEAATLTGTATGLRGNTTYLWYASATATQGDVVKSADTSRVPRTVLTGQLPAPEEYKTFTATVKYEGAAAENVPVLLRISESAIDGFDYDDVTASGFEIVDGNGNLLPWEIDTWDETGESLLWVRLPVWENGAAITVRYGAEFANSPFAASRTWMDYVGVWHLNDTNSASAYGSYPNSTATAGIDGEKALASVADEEGALGRSVMVCPAASKKGEGFQLGGVFVPDSGLGSPLDLGNTFVISGWFKHKDFDYYYDKFFGKRGKANNDSAVPPTGAFAIESSSDGAENKLSVFGGGGTFKSVNLNSTLRNTWSYLTFVYDGSTASVYQNGALCGSGTVNPVTDNDGWLCFGNLTGGYGDGTGDCGWCGWIDEVRLADGTPSAAWIAAEYAAMADVTAISFSPATAVDAATPELSVPTIARNADGSFTVSVVVSENIPASVSCLVGGVSYPMATSDAALPMTYSAVLSDLSAGTHVASVKAMSTTGNAAYIDCQTVFHTGALTIEATDADEGTLTPGVFRISRADADATDLPELTFDVAFSGDGLAAVVAPGIATATIPAGAAYVDIVLAPVVTDAVDEDADIVLAVSGANVGMPSSETLTVFNADYDVFVRYVSTEGSDENHGGTPELPKKTIGAAVSSLANIAPMFPCTVHVASGLYPNSSPIVVTNAIHILGDDPDPSRVIVSNTIEASYWSTDQRVFRMDHAEALIANLTMQKGQDYGNGGNILIGSAGGMVSNCVVEAGYTRDNGKAGGAWLDAGVVTHTVFRKNNTNSGSVWWNSAPSEGVLHLGGSSRAENCLFDNNPQSVTVTLVGVRDSAVLRNCTIVNAGLSATNSDYSVWSALKIDSGATVQNVVIAGVTNKIDGAACPPTGSVAKFQNGAFDGDVTGLPEGTVTGTAAEFFADYEHGDYTPGVFSPLANAGVEYEGMAATDLAGKKRKVGKHIDIGCYECQKEKGFFILLR